MQRPLEGRVALVTGGGVRLGRALAVGLAHSGASVAVHYNGSELGAKQAAEEIAADGNATATFKADLTQKGAPAALVDEVEKKLGPVSILVNSAGIFHRIPFTETSEDVLELQWSINAKAPYLLTQAVAKRMLERDGGDVLNILDIGGTISAWANYSAYCMSKAAFGMLTKCLALELAPKIRVNGIAPGTVMPPEDMPQETLDLLKQRIPQKRFGSADDVVQAARFFLTGPRFVTGQILAVDGGRSVGLPPHATGSDVA